MLMSAQDSLLLVVDMQTRLLGAIAEHERLARSVVWLLRAARLMNVPVLATEQNPQGLGPTDPAIAAELPDSSAVGKLEFSCAAARCFAGQGAPAQSQVIVCGIEAHVCVLQTALELNALGRQVFVVADAIGSRNPADVALALERLRMSGVQVVSCEMVGFEWLRAAGSDTFRQFSKTLLRG